MQREFYFYPQSLFPKSPKRIPCPTRKSHIQQSQYGLRTILEIDPSSLSVLILCIVITVMAVILFMRLWKLVRFFTVRFLIFLLQVCLGFFLCVLFIFSSLGVWFLKVHAVNDYNGQFSLAKTIPVMLVPAWWHYPFLGFDPWVVPDGLRML